MAEPESGEQSESEHRWLVRGLAYALEVLLLVVGLAGLLVAVILHAELSLPLELASLAVTFVFLLLAGLCAAAFGLRDRADPGELRRAAVAYLWILALAVAGGLLLYVARLSYSLWLMIAFYSYLAWFALTVLRCPRYASGTEWGGALHYFLLLRSRGAARGHPRARSALARASSGGQPVGLH